MSIRQGLLALLEGGPRYGYELRAEFEPRTGGTWPLNVGQVYTTLSRLERDGLVEPAGEDDEGHVIYQLTDAGRAEVITWFATPVAPRGPPRDELAIKLAMAVTVPGRRRRHAWCRPSAPTRCGRCRTTPGSNASADQPTSPGR